jgi:limonene-1,2-epoxide hydrolase
LSAIARAFGNGKSKGRSAGEAKRLRELADWYRVLAERTDNPAIWDARLRTAEELEAEADRIGTGPPVGGDDAASAAK